ncbi:MAG: VWA domain-containing protein [Candidatus Omnitrophota bacterium]
MIFHDLWNGLLLLMIIPPVIIIYLKGERQGRIIFSSLKNLKRLKPSRSLKFKQVLIILRLLAIFLLIVGLMRPQQGIEETKIETEGVDIILAIDVSGSMMAEDFVVQGQRKNRLEVVKDVVRDFIKKRTNDRIGLVVFAQTAYMQCPLTLDYGVLLEFLDKIELGIIPDGTAVGDGISCALSRLKDIESKSKIIILLTDGVNNAGKVDPENAAQLAQALKVKIYTIGAGSKGKVPFPARDLFGNKAYQWAVIDLDEESLKSIAEQTQGRYFRAQDVEALKKIYEEIDKLEKTKAEVKSYSEYHELFKPFVLIALGLLLIEAVLSNTRFRTLP